VVIFDLTVTTILTLDKIISKIIYRFVNISFVKNVKSVISRQIAKRTSAVQKHMISSPVAATIWSFMTIALKD
jgi:hypothetical protein